MKLDTVEQRQNLIEEMRKTTAKFKESVDYETADDELCGAEVILDDLVALTPMIVTEKLFLDLLAEIKRSDLKEPSPFANIVSNRLSYFVEMVLMHKLDNAVENLHRWDFKTEDGRKFFRSTHKKLDTLVEKYQDVYDL